jgi:phosphonopyruvate decarboxylase
MISVEHFFNKLKFYGIDFFSGVPDSLLADFSAYLEDHVIGSNHVIAANEGNSVALAIGYYLATKKNSVVYMQNSGLGNSINPLVSLADKQVYEFPILMIVGWRGEPGVNDEPQHIKQGQITQSQLDLLDIPYFILDANVDWELILDQAVSKLNANNSPVALLVRKGAFSSYHSSKTGKKLSYITRYQALETILDLSCKDLIVTTTGKTSREVFEIRKSKLSKQGDFLTVGGMGHASSIALGLAIGLPQKRVICIDGDGAMIMHMGALSIIGSIAPANYLHILLNNGAHDSVGGQPTVAGGIDFEALSVANGYKKYIRASTVEEIKSAWSLAGSDGPIMIEVLIKLGSDQKLGRPTSTPKEIKKMFIDAVNE